MGGRALTRRAKPADPRRTRSVFDLHYDGGMKVALALVALCGCTVGDVAPGPAPDSAGPQPDAPAGGAGSLQITATSTTQNGQYAPLNCTVVWVESAGGTIAKTIDRKCGVRAQHLVAWGVKSGGPGADDDAVTGASRANHTTPLSITWDLEDRAGAVIADGTYTIRMESTEVNAIAANENNQGTFTFVKGATAQMQTALTNGGFQNVSITFTPP